MSRIEKNILNGDYISGQILEHKDINKIVEVLKAGVNANFDDITQLKKGVNQSNNSLKVNEDSIKEINNLTKANKENIETLKINTKNLQDKLRDDYLTRDNIIELIIRSKNFISVYDNLSQVPPTLENNTIFILKSGINFELYIKHNNILNKIVGGSSGSGSGNSLVNATFENEKLNLILEDGRVISVNITFDPTKYKGEKGTSLTDIVLDENTGNLNFYYSDGVIQKSDITPTIKKELLNRNNYMFVYMTVDQVPIYSRFTYIPFTNSVTSNDELFKFQNNGSVIIGKGVKKIKVSFNAAFNCPTPNRGYIYNSVSLNNKNKFSSIAPVGTSIYTHVDVSVCYLDVKENDVISFFVDTDGDFPIKIRQDGTYAGIEVVEYDDVYYKEVTTNTFKTLNSSNLVTTELNKVYNLDLLENVKGYKQVKIILGKDINSKNIIVDLFPSLGIVGTTCRYVDDDNAGVFQIGLGTDIGDNNPNNYDELYIKQKTNENENLGTTGVLKVLGLK